MRLEQLGNKGNVEAFSVLSSSYIFGLGVPQDYQKANELLLKAGELGCAMAYYNLGTFYLVGKGVDVDLKKAKYYFELAAIGGDVLARYNLGCLEGQSGKVERAIKHWIIAARVGCKDSLAMIKKGYMNREITKDEYASTLRAHQKANDAAKSEARDKATEIIATRRYVWS